MTSQTAESVAQTLSVADVSPIYRYYSGSLVDHFYTTNFWELRCGDGTSDYVYERTIGYIAKRTFAGTTPLYRFYSPKQQRHLYQLSATPPSNYQSEGIVGY